MFLVIFFFNDTATTEIYTLSLHDALPIWNVVRRSVSAWEGSRIFSIRLWSSNFASPSGASESMMTSRPRSEEHTSELQSLAYLVCRLLLEKKKYDVMFDKLVGGQRTYCQV